MRLRTIKGMLSLIMKQQVNHRTEQELDTYILYLYILGKDILCQKVSDLDNKII